MSFEPYWNDFIRTIEKTYLDTQYLCNISQETMAGDLGVKVILFPLASDIDQIEANYLGEFIKRGGKLIISSGPLLPSQRLKSFLSEYGILLSKNVISDVPFHLKHRVDDTLLQLPIGSFYSDFNVDGLGGKIIARWQENARVSIAAKGSLIYFGYPIGKSTDYVSEANTVLSSLNYYFPDVIYPLEKEITYEEYEKIIKNLFELRDKAQYAISIVDELNLSVPYFELKKYLSTGFDDLQKFGSNYLASNFLKARYYASAATNNLSLVLSLAVPVRKAEVRAIWLDRETIVKSKNPKKLKKLIKDIADAGFNVIFFETINAGYSIYPSMLLEQNPMIQRWDPLQVAIEAAHENNIEIHAWVWTFAVGNSRHNILIGESPSFPGPVIASKGRRWALTGKLGKLRIAEQPEFWISPANEQACKFLTEVFSEIVKNYNVDGVQLDYIRFPFQNKEDLAGFDFLTRMQFKKETNYFPSVQNDKYKKWITWKTNKVNQFVKNISSDLKKIKPNLNISVAVFAMPKESRIETIQQDWETWALNRWVNVIYPFYYSYTADEIKDKFELSMKETEGKVLIIPGFNLSILNEGELSERLIAARDIGALGTALFAFVHLDKQMKDILVTGPYRKKAEVIPYQQPGLAVVKLFDEFVPLVDRLTGSSTSKLLASKETKNEVMGLIEELRSELKYNEAKNIDVVESKLKDLEGKVFDLMRLEEYVRGDNKTVFLNGYINQLDALLKYMKTNK